MWFKQGISLDDSNFDMDNSSSSVDVNLLLKRILDNYWNKLFYNFCITVCRFYARVQSWTCATYEKSNNGHANSEIGYTTDCLYSFWDREECWFLHAVIICIFPPAINFCRSKEKFSQVYWAIMVTRYTDL